ncbi:hypothetical protein B0H14DRAFT_3452234 [Mycena olivaceomarginata]|nr:hypothetical protein B0H14DRAFT_3452234 [Mycena olivaceomarginata]
MATTPNWNAAPPTYDAHSLDSTQLRPYLQLPHLISLTWLAYPILSLIFVVFRIQLSLASSQDAVASAKSDLLTSCKAAEKAATAAASMPRYMAIATNEQFASAVNDSMNAAREALILALTIMEAIINFIVDIYRSTFLCFLELVIRGGLAILIGAVQELNVVVQAAASGIRTLIQDTFGAANDALAAVAKAGKVIGISVPTLTVPDLRSPDSITALNNTLPTFNELKQAVEQFIDTPFELLKADINETFSGLSFNSSVLAVPEQSTLSFCTDLDTSVIDDLGHDLVKIAKIGTIILILLILILIGLNCLLEWYKWRCQRRHLEYTRQAWTTDPTLPTALIPSLRASPTLSLPSCGSLLRKHINLQWFLHYVFHPPALACFLIGFFGLLSVELQLIAIHPLVDKYSGKAADTVTDFSNTIATNINASMYNQSAAYASSVNGHVDTIQSTINDGLFGWVNSTTTTLNTTIETFYEDIQNAVDTVFKGTILDAPIQEFIKCIIGSKVDAIENALTFLHDNLNINMPPHAAAAVGDNDGDGGLIAKLVNSYAASLRKERLMFGIFMGLWGIVAPGAVSGRGSSGSLPLAEEKGYGSNVGNTHPDLPSFTPLPSLALSESSASKPKLGSFNPFRSTSPKPKNSDAPGSMDTFQQSNNRSWDTFFEKPKSTRSNVSTKEISKPMKLMAFGQRGREVFVGDRRAPTPPLSTDESEPSERRTTKWFARFAGRLGKSQQSPTIEPYPEFSPNRNSGARARPSLRITVDHPASDLPSDAGQQASVQAAPVSQEQTQDHSRWSVSPENTARGPLARPWTGLMSPTGAWRHKHKPSVPSNVNSMDGSSLYDTRASVQATPLAMPLHSGFEVPRKQAILPQHPAGFKAALAPEPRHRRSVSDAPGPLRQLTVRNGPDAPTPVSPPTPSDPFSDVHKLVVPPASDPSPSTPVTRLLTTTHARRSSSVDPFVTPFDDEHRVTMRMPTLLAHARACRPIPSRPLRSRIWNPDRCCRSRPLISLLIPHTTPIIHFTNGLSCT